MKCPVKPSCFRYRFESQEENAEKAGEIWPGLESVHWA
jgi:hypothetical protein